MMVTKLIPPDAQAAALQDYEPEHVLMDFAQRADERGARHAAQVLYSLYNGGSAVSLWNLGGPLNAPCRAALLVLLARSMDGMPMRMGEEECRQLLYAHPSLAEPTA